MDYFSIDLHGTAFDAIDAGGAAEEVRAADENLASPSQDNARFATTQSEFAVGRHDDLVVLGRGRDLEIWAGADLVRRHGRDHGAQDDGAAQVAPFERENEFRARGHGTNVDAGAGRDGRAAWVFRKIDEWYAEV